MLPVSCAAVNCAALSALIDEALVKPWAFFLSEKEGWGVQNEMVSLDGVGFNQGSS